MNMHLSAIDYERFGVITAKAALGAGDHLPDVLDWCAARAVEMLIVRCATADIALVQQMEQAAFFLTDTLVYFRKQAIAAQPAVLPEGYTTRLAGAADAEAVGRLAGLSFAGYCGHYHADPRLDKADADLVYSSWAASACRDGAVADAVVLIECAAHIVAFATLKKLEAGRFEGVLFGVHPGHQGRGLYQALMQLAQNWAGPQQIDQMLVSTQITNLAVQKIWCRQRFEPFKSYYTFHKWC